MIGARRRRPPGKRLGAWRLPSAPTPSTPAAVPRPTSDSRKRIRGMEWSGCWGRAAQHVERGGEPAVHAAQADGVFRHARVSDHGEPDGDGHGDPDEQPDDHGGSGVRSDFRQFFIGQPEKQRGDD